MIQFKTKMMALALLACASTASAREVYFFETSSTSITSSESADIILRPPHRGPSGNECVYATLNDHTLFLWDTHNGYTLTLLDDNDTVVYQTYIAAGVQYAVLPTTLSGSFTLILSDDTYMFTGVIDLG